MFEEGLLYQNEDTNLKSHTQWTVWDAVATGGGRARGEVRVESAAKSASQSSKKADHKLALATSKAPSASESSRPDPRQWRKVSYGVCAQSRTLKASLIPRSPHEFPSYDCPAFPLTSTLVRLCNSRCTAHHGDARMVRLSPKQEGEEREAHTAKGKGEAEGGVERFDTKNSMPRYSWKAGGLRDLIGSW